ncbi:MAG: phosphate propanoyltransferase [Lachnospiraceae bacterium]|nr:phosphate propanoyltransferase [Lachnospiraceae bacterium]
MRNEIPVEVSARHVHLSQEQVEILFGEGHQLTPDKMLSQPGQYLSKERVTIVGPKKKMERVGVLGPARKHGQVELSLTDCFAIGIKTAVVRESGDISGTPGVVLESETASVTLEEGVIVAKRHIHMTPDEAKEFGVSDKQVVQVEINQNGRATIYGDVVVRVHETYALAMHIDTDEANAALVSGDVIGIIK